MTEMRDATSEKFLRPIENRRILKKYFQLICLRVYIGSDAIEPQSAIGTAISILSVILSRKIHEVCAIRSATNHEP